MINVNYQKRKNLELFKCLEKPEKLFLSNAQNYIPIYNKFFTLNDSNYNSINLNNKWYISNLNNLFLVLHGLEIPLMNLLRQLPQNDSSK